MVAVALGGALAGCGGGGGGGNAAPTTTATPAAAVNPAANPVAAPPIGGVALTTGSAVHQITTTVAAFYRAAWENNAAGACSLFSPTGMSGFMRAAKVSFPASVNSESTCADAMKIYNATLAASVQNLQDGSPSVTGSSLNSVTIGKIHIQGNVATAIGPLNALPEINPKLIRLVKMGRHWLIDGSYSLSKSNLPELLKQSAKAGKHK